MKTRYYPWQNEGSNNRPWERQYVDSQFAIHERRFLRQAKEWHHRFQHGQGSDHSGVQLFTVPCRLDSILKAEIHARGRLEAGLSLLPNTYVGGILGLFLPGKRPQVNRPIWVSSAKKVNVFHHGRKEAVPALLVEEYVPLPAIHHYGGEGLGTGGLIKFLDENLSLEPNLITSLGIPLVSSPPNYVAGGGNSFATLKGTTPSKTVRTFLETLELMAPPAMRKSKVPVRLAKGIEEEVAPGVHLRFAERPPPHDDLVYGTRMDSINGMLTEHRLRSGCDNERSVYSTIGPARSTKRELLTEFLLEFTRSDVALPLKLNELLDSDFVFKRFAKAIDYRVWSQVILDHEIIPEFNASADELGRTIEQARKHYEAMLSDLTSSPTVLAVYADRVVRNAADPIRRNAQALARSAGRLETEEEHIAASWRLLKANFEEFTGRDDVRRLKVVRPKTKTRVTYDVLQGVMAGQPAMGFTEIFEYVKPYNVFESPGNLQGLLDWCVARNHLIADAKGNYKWIGAHLERSG